jgi:hypothetical protein
MENGSFEEGLLFFFVVIDVLQLPEGGNFEALHCQLSTNFDRSTKFDLTTEPPLLGRCCCAFGILFLFVNLFPFWFKFYFIEVKSM